MFFSTLQLLFLEKKKLNIVILKKKIKKQTKKQKTKINRMYLIKKTTHILMKKNTHTQSKSKTTIEMNGEMR